MFPYPVHIGSSFVVYLVSCAIVLAFFVYVSQSVTATVVSPYRMNNPDGHWLY